MKSIYCRTKGTAEKTAVEVKLTITFYTNCPNNIKVRKRWKIPEEHREQGLEENDIKNRIDLLKYFKTR